MAGLANAGELNLPDPFVMQDGSKVTTKEDWTAKRRPETLELFKKHVYGRPPLGRPKDLTFEVVETVRDAMDGAATLKRVNVNIAGPGGKVVLRLGVFIPNKAAKPVPCFLLGCNRGPENIDMTRKKKSPFWPAEQIVARGYAAAAFLLADIDPDKYDGFKDGVHGVFDPKDGRKGDSWGTICAWAWGAGRALDYLCEDADIDNKHVAVIGHSRGGKTALWAGAMDERFALTISNDSGCTGAALARRRKGETVARINKVFKHWFCENYKKYNDKENELPVDQHQLVALMAPRLVYVASASKDAWADPEGEFLACVHASPVYKLFGLTGIESTEMPKPDTPLHGGCIGYHIRTGKHNLTEYDWKCYMDFADRHWRGKNK
jgi:hypothetical protein